MDASDIWENLELVDVAIDEGGSVRLRMENF